MGTLLITGGAGFIGSNLVRHALAHTDDRLVVVDKLTYAGSLLNVAGVLNDPRLTFIEGDIADPVAMAHVFAEHRPRAVLNLAAETHVDRSIDSPRSFIDANIVGTFVLLECARKHVGGASSDGGAAFRFLHVTIRGEQGVGGSSGACLFPHLRAPGPNHELLEQTCATGCTSRITARRCCWCCL